MFCITTVQANTLVDPTKPSGNTLGTSANSDENAMTQSPIKLTAIINHQQYKQAIINGESLIEGQTIRGYKVVSISQNYVILDGTEGKQTLYVNNNNVKKDANNEF
jgi:MSHA biogenesis protein MshK